jgi:site-specific DNA-methyltransferase (adenine-specific)
MPKIELLQGDCLEKMKDIPDKSIDMVLCDLPYGTTACKWDTIIPFEPLWEQYKRIIKDNGAIVLTASQPFTSALVMSNVKMFKYDLKWIKTEGTGFYNANRMPLRAHEDILLFYKKLPVYNPQKTEGKPYKIKRGSASDVYVGKDLVVTDNVTGDRHPLSWKVFTKDKNKLHPTQKPVALFEYLIKTYTNEGDLVLDNCMGSGTTGVACKNLNRNFIGIELDTGYFRIAEKRINENL